MLRRLSLLQPKTSQCRCQFPIQSHTIWFLLLNLISFHCHHVIIYTDSKWWFINNQGFSSINPLTRMKLMRNEESDALRSTSTKETTIINGVETKPNGKFSDRKQTQLTYQWYDKWKKKMNTILQFLSLSTSLPRLRTNEHMQIQAPKSPNPISGDIDNLQAVTEISSVNEISEHQRHRHQHISNPLVNRRP